MTLNFFMGSSRTYFINALDADSLEITNGIYNHNKKVFIRSFYLIVQLSQLLTLYSVSCFLVFFL